MKKRKINVSLEAVHTHTHGYFTEKGITLIALVITIIVLLILAGVSITMLTGENGILNQANKAKEDTRAAEIEEREKLSKNEDYITEALISWDNVPSEVWSVTSEGVLTVANENLLNKYSNIRIPSEVNGIKITAIGERAFQFSGSMIKNIIIPEGITDLKSMSFNSSVNLEYVSLPQSLVKIGSLAFQNCQKLKEVKIPNNVTTIEGEAFGNCPNLKNVYIGNRVKNIGMQAFDHTSIQTIIIPSSVETLGWCVFLNCKTLENIYIESTDISFGGDVFGSTKYRIKAGSTIYVRNPTIGAALSGQYNPEDTTISTNYNW